MKEARKDACARSNHRAALKVHESPGDQASHNHHGGPCDLDGEGPCLSVNNEPTARPIGITEARAAGYVR
ncbi:hypothetical protein BSFA1_79760 (plasmid) [Burkholderia sp. SFA1]|nr:hypothetical protein BSFA1_79760 [Burkholderia sp. SFA1]